MRGDLQPDLASDVPSLLVACQVHLAAHDQGDKLIRRGEPLVLDAVRVLRIFVVWVGAENRGARALEITEGGAAAGVEQRLNGGVRGLRRGVELRHGGQGGDAVVELARPAGE